MEVNAEEGFGFGGEAGEGEGEGEGEAFGEFETTVAAADGFMAAAVEFADTVFGPAGVETTTFGP